MQYGIVTGCDQSHEWMLPWFYSNFRKTNPTLPITFANFGNMTQDTIKWCQENGTYLDLSGYKTRLPWFRKPMALFHSKYDKVCWIDLDIEVRKDISKIFDYCDKDRIAVTYDLHNTFSRNYDWKVIKTKAVATGVVCAVPSNELLIEWCQWCLKGYDSRDRVLRGDQEVFLWLLSIREDAKYYKTKLNILNPHWQWLRLSGNLDDPRHIMVHWTGIDGKSHIKKLIEQQQNENKNKNDDVPSVDVGSTGLLLDHNPPEPAIRSESTGKVRSRSRKRN